MEWIAHRYGNPPLYLTENGCSLDDRLENGAVHDKVREEFIKSYLAACHKALENGVNLKGYFVWSFMDNFEWALGYSKRFGIHYVDYETLERTPKNSALWYKKTIADNGFEFSETIIKI